MDNKKKKIYIKYIFIGLIFSNGIFLALSFFDLFQMAVFILMGIEIVFLCIIFFLLQRQDYIIRAFRKKNEKKNLEQIFIFCSAEERAVLDFFVHNREEKKNLFLESKREAQILALQNQINPHFLYNTLETIRSDAISNGALNAGTMAEALATFFRYTISNLDYLVQIVDELENIQNYFTIQHCRFGNKISIRIIYDERDNNVLKLYIPKLILQPIVENAIYHGIEQKLGAGQVIISITYTRQNLDIIISDDGIGIKDDVLLIMNEYLSMDYENYGHEKLEKNGGIAIRNVNQRIKLLFGEDYGVRLNSIYGIGTDVHIKLPVVLTPNDFDEKVNFKNNTGD